MENQISSCHLCSASIVIGAIVLLVVLKLYFKGGVCKGKRDLTGKVIVITGGNAGIGKETVQVLAGKSCTVIFGARDKIKSEAVLRQVMEKIPKCNLLFFPLDLGDKKSVQEFSSNIKKSCSKIDVLINNAGLVSKERRLTKDGFEMTIGVNHFGHFYLTYLLWSLIKAADSPRIINVASTAHRGAGFFSKKLNYIDFGDINIKSGYSARIAYSRSKMANILFTKELQARMDKAGIQGSSYCLHPGVILTQIARDFGAFVSVIRVLLFPVIAIFLKTCREGAQTTLHLTLQESYKLPRGVYYKDCKPYPATKFCSSTENAEQLWKMSEDMLGIKFEV